MTLTIELPRDVADRFLERYSRGDRDLFATHADEDALAAAIIEAEAS